MEDSRLNPACAPSKSCKLSPSKSFTPDVTSHHREDSDSDSEAVYLATTEVVDAPVMLELPENEVSSKQLHKILSLKPDFGPKPNDHDYARYLNRVSSLVHDTLALGI
jgi:hypothetical protein